MEMSTQQYSEQYAFDVVVAGGGPAGLGAAVAAAQNGAKTLLVEQRAFFGGVAALGLWMPLNRVLIDGKPRPGFAGLLVKKLKEFGPEVVRIGEHEIHVHPEYLKLVTFEILEEVGVTYLLHSKVAEVIKHSNTIRGVVLESKSGKIRVDAKVVVDATGDGDVAALAGAEWLKGREDDGFLSPMTLLFAVGNVDMDRFDAFRRKGGNLREILKEGSSEGYILPEAVGLDRATLPGIVSVNSSGTKTLGSLDGTNVWDLTKAERHGRRMAVDFVRLMRDKAIPGFESCYLLYVSPQIAVRETRRIVGEYTLTEEDVTVGNRFDDVVARRYGFLDVGYVLFKPMASPHDVPYRCLLPKTIDNLLVAGRCISTSHISHSAGKSMGNQMAIGMAAGTAAALSVRHNLPPRKINVKELQCLLVAQGMQLVLAK